MRCDRQADPQSASDTGDLALTRIQRFDYIIVGGGTAGCVVAARLSQDPATRVLVLEAGGAEPTAEMANPMSWLTLPGTSVDWNYATVPQPGTNNAVHRWPRGKVLGGSSGINGMMHVRGDRSSYDTWETAGAAGWNYDALLPFFKRSERAVGRDPAYRGLDGPVTVAPPSMTAFLWEACFEADLQAGYPFNDDSNGATAEGVAWTDMNVVDGVRQSAADAYLKPAAGRSNLIVVTEALVCRLLIESSCCRGVEYICDGQTHRSYADREVVLTAGAIGTPHLLLLSAIGPGQHLRDVGISAVADLPGVGANLHDHPKSEVTYTARRPVRTGVYARKAHVLLRSETSATPDIQIIFADNPIHPRWTPGPENGYSVICALMSPASRGSLQLASADPRQAPLIDPNYLADERDMQRMVCGLRVAREVGTMEALAPVRERELFPGPDAWTDTMLHAHLRRSISTYYHPVGTCKIGNDVMSVVDAQLRLYGISNVRVADASVMPSIVSGNTNAAVLAIAERAASMLVSDST